MKRILTLTAVLIMICSTTLAYVGNRNTRKFHHNSCSSVFQMKPSNRVYIETRDVSAGLKQPFFAGQT